MSLKSHMVGNYSFERSVHVGYSFRICNQKHLKTHFFVRYRCYSIRTSHLKSWKWDAVTCICISHAQEILTNIPSEEDGRCWALSSELCENSAFKSQPNALQQSCHHNSAGQDCPVLRAVDHVPVMGHLQITHCHKSAAHRLRVWAFAGAPGPLQPHPWAAAAAWIGRPRGRVSSAQKSL